VTKFSTKAITRQLTTYECNFLLPLVATRWEDAMGISIVPIEVNHIIIRVLTPEKNHDIHREAFVQTDEPQFEPKPDYDGCLRFLVRIAAIGSRFSGLAAILESIFFVCYCFAFPLV
jgi:hypothetical protein